jgi:hypothetical protein
MMTRKDYVAVARIIAEAETDTHEGRRNLDRLDVVNAFARLFAEDNARFDADRFRAACESKVTA